MAEKEDGEGSDEQFQKVELYRQKILSLINEEGEETFKKRITADKRSFHPEAGQLFSHIFQIQMKK